MTCLLRAVQPPCATNESSAYFVPIIGLLSWQDSLHQRLSTFFGLVAYDRQLPNLASHPSKDAVDIQQTLLFLIWHSVLTAAFSIDDACAIHGLIEREVHHRDS